MVEFHALTVAAVDQLCEDAAAVTFDVPPTLSEAFAFKAGQSLTIRRRVAGREERRSYSICAPVGDRPRIGVREIPEGLFSSWLVHEVTPGTEIEVQPPSGALRADPTTAARHLLIAAGSGITPMISIAASVLANPDTRVSLVYANRTTASVMFAEELADLKNRYGARFQLVHVLSREARDVELLSGRLEPDRLRRVLTALVPIDSVDEVWLCGPHRMITGAREVLAELGVDEAKVHVELFHVDEPPPDVRRVEAVPTGETSEVTIILDGRSATVALSRDEPILDGAQATRTDLPFACKGGVCGTCRARVTDGEVDMRRNYALDDDEVERGFVLTCQSRPVTAAVTVDYDA